MRHPFVRIVIPMLALLVSVPPAFAAGEDGDAGELPATAQDLSGEQVQRIDGAIGADGDDIDMYKLCLDGGGDFSATTVGGSTLDTELFLFRADGRGVYANDDVNGVRQSRLPAGHALTPQAEGEYYLAVGPYNSDPASSLGSIFPDLASVVGPTGRGGGEPVTRWGGRPGNSGSYSIFLTGAECEPPDTTPPTVVIDSPADGAVFERDTPVTVRFSCADEGGSGIASCAGTVDDGDQLDTSQPGPGSVTVTARDNAGNETSVTHDYSVVAVDRTAPLIELLSPVDGAEYLLDEEVFADYSCADEKGGSGLAYCFGSALDGEPIHTSTVGPHSFRVLAGDEAGNSSFVMHDYRVIYDFEGFLFPVRNRPKVNTWKAGVRVPIRFDLDGRQGLDVIEDGWPQVAEVGCDFGEEPEGGEPAEHWRLVFRRRKQHYVLLWKTERDWAGSCRQFILKLDDGTMKRADFEFVRRRHDHDDD